MVIDNSGDSIDGRIYTTWTDGTPGTKIKFAFSIDTGKTFPIKKTLDSVTTDAGAYAYFVAETTIQGAFSGPFVTGAFPAIGPGGQVASYGCTSIPVTTNPR